MPKRKITGTGTGRKGGPGWSDAAREAAAKARGAKWGAGPGGVKSASKPVGAVIRRERVARGDHLAKVKPGDKLPPSHAAKPWVSSAKSRRVAAHDNEIKQQDAWHRKQSAAGRKVVPEVHRAANQKSAKPYDYGYRRKLSDGKPIERKPVVISKITGKPIGGTPARKKKK